MSRGSENVVEKQEFNSGLKAAESPRREEPRQLSLTQRGYRFTMENNLSSSEKESNALRRTIDHVYAETADRSKLEIALIMLKAVKVRYESTVHDLESLFMQDKWGDFTETANSVRWRGRTLIDLALSAILEAMNKLDKTGLRLKGTTSLYSDHLKSRNVRNLTSHDHATLPQV